MGAGSPSSETPGERADSSAVEESLPFFFVGTAVLAAGVYLLLAHSSLLPTRLPIPELLLAVGSIALTGGTVGSLIPDDVVTPTVGAPSARPSPPSPSAPELTARPAAATKPRVREPFQPVLRVHRAIWEEDWDVDSEEFKAAAAPPAPTDLVLEQIEEIEAALREKRKSATDTEDREEPS